MQEVIESHFCQRYRCVENNYSKAISIDDGFFCKEINMVYEKNITYLYNQDNKLISTFRLFVNEDFYELWIGETNHYGQPLIIGLVLNDKQKQLMLNGIEGDLYLGFSMSDLIDYLLYFHKVLQLFNKSV
ncbi:hypothetical protein WJR50_21575 [Catalinimonas sp. 4WD22]|uniref:hypothetical protein n=1 Tax=Catalinimonas locisalis TaxID=3133978 RepID=UPI0031010AB7